MRGSEKGFSRLHTVDVEPNRSVGRTRSETHQKKRVNKPSTYTPSLTLARTTAAQKEKKKTPAASHIHRDLPSTPRLPTVATCFASPQDSPLHTHGTHVQFLDRLSLPPSPVPTLTYLISHWFCLEIAAGKQLTSVLISFFLFQKGSEKGDKGPIDSSFRLFPLPILHPIQIYRSVPFLSLQKECIQLNWYGVYCIELILQRTYVEVPKDSIVHLCFCTQDAILHVSFFEQDLQLNTMNSEFIHVSFASKGSVLTCFFFFLLHVAKYPIRKQQRIGLNF